MVVSGGIILGVISVVVETEAMRSEVMKVLITKIDSCDDCSLEYPTFRG